MRPGALHSLYHLSRLRRQHYWRPDKLEQLRRQKLADLLDYCYRRIPYYQEQFKRIGATPQDFQAPEDLVHFPILEKATLRDHPEAFFDPQADRKSWISYRSSGSTGIPLELWYLPTERQQMGFVMTRELLFHGFKPWLRLVNVTEPRHSSPKNRWYHRLGFMQERFLSVYDDPALNAKRLREIHPDYLIGFPSVLILIGKALQTESEPPLRPPKVFTIAEVLTQDYQKWLEELWGVKPIDLYGCNETGHIGFQCEQRQGYHINVDSLHVEFIASGKPVEVGQRGEIVVTNFDLRVMPIIRYRVGDVAQRLDRPCSCGCSFPLMGEVSGRSDGFLVGAQGKIFSALEIALFLKEVPGINQYRLIQENLRSLRFEWEPKNSKAQPEGKIRSLLQERFGSDLSIDIVRVARLEPERSGKIRTVISKLPAPFWTSTFGGNP